MHQMTLPRLKHHAADPKDPSTGVAEVAGGAGAVESAVAAGAAKASMGAAITVAATVLKILLDISLPYNELCDVRRATRLRCPTAGQGLLNASRVEPTSRHPIRSSIGTRPCQQHTPGYRAICPELGDQDDEFSA